MDIAVVFVIIFGIIVFIGFWGLIIKLAMNWDKKQKANRKEMYSKLEKICDEDYYDPQVTEYEQKYKKFICNTDNELLKNNLTINDIKRCKNDIVGDNGVISSLNNKFVLFKYDESSIDESDFDEMCDYFNHVDYTKFNVEELINKYELYSGDYRKKIKSEFRKIKNMYDNNDHDGIIDTFNLDMEIINVLDFTPVLFKILDKSDILFFIVDKDTKTTGGQGVSTVGAMFTESLFGTAAANAKTMRKSTTRIDTTYTTTIYFKEECHLEPFIAYGQDKYMKIMQVMPDKLKTNI